MILIGIGANLPGPGGEAPLETCRRAVSSLRCLPGLQLAAVSRWYASDPVPPTPGVPPYVNGVVRLEGETEPAALLAALLAIEADAGRERPFRNAPRSLDLDLLDLHGAVRDHPDPVLPHPRLHLRAFVLRPLAELAPGWRHPRTGADLAELVAALPEQELRPLDDQQ